MKRFVSAVCLCVCLLLLGVFSAFSPVSEAQEDTLSQLLNLPAPPPPNPLVEKPIRRGADFYDKENPPPDDASVEELLDYWRSRSIRYQELGYNPKPSEKVLQKILAKIEENPELLSGYLNVLPETQETADFVKRIYDQLQNIETIEAYELEGIKTWLTYHSNYYSDELEKVAAQVGDTDEYVRNQEELLALARVDWERARPILERLYNDRSQPVSQTLARWAFYRHALDTGDTLEAERYRDELKAVVEDKNALPGSRDLALDALVKERDFEGRDDWYFKLLEDETLAELRINGQLYTGLTTPMYYAPSGKYADKMIELLKSDNPAARNAAIRNLTLMLDEKNPEIIRALLPWLENPNWAKETSEERRRVVEALKNFLMPESVPGLIAVLNEKVKIDVPNYNGNANVGIYSTNTTRVLANTNSGYYGANVATVQREVYPFRYSAVGALTKQKDIRAVPALKAILPEVQEWERSMVVRAILASGGYTVAEQIEALEAIAKSVIEMEEAQKSYNANMVNAANMVMTNSTGNRVYYPRANTNTYYPMANTNSYYSMANTNSYYTRPYNPGDVKNILGTLLANSSEDVSDALINGLIDHIEDLDERDPKTAQTLRQIMLGWKGAAINSLMLRDLKKGKADVDTIVKLLSLRRELREKQVNEVYEMRAGGNPLAIGIGACLLENPNEYDAILGGASAETKTAMLGCARLIRARLPLQSVAANLNSQDELLATAAERYLESEDSPEARRIVLGLHPNEAKVLGARTYFIPENVSPTLLTNMTDLFISVDESVSLAPYAYISGYFSDLVENEERLKTQVLEDAEILGVYSYDKNHIYIYKDKAVFRWDDGEARYRERVLRQPEFDNLKGYLASQRADELPPFLTACEYCQTKELLMLGRNGGRRVFVRATNMPKFFAELDSIFAAMRKQPARLRYRLEKDVAGLEILFADDNLQARSVWKTGADFRVLTEDAERRKQIDKDLSALERAEEEKEDYDYEKGEILSQTRRRQRAFDHLMWQKFENGKFAGSAGQPALIEFIPARDTTQIQATAIGWKARTAAFEIRAGDEGLYKITRGQAVQIREGSFESPFVTPNGRWLIVRKYDYEEGGTTLVRINLLNNRETKINIERYPTYEPLAFIPAINKVLVFAGYYPVYDASQKIRRSGEYFLLDPETGAVQPAKGEIEPLAQQTYRPLQPTGKADEFWAAIPGIEKTETQVGVYNARTLTFKSLLNIPQITFDSMDMWVDENKIYFVYEGHLLSLPLPKQ